MGKKDATIEQADAAWKTAGEYWNSLDTSKYEYPWLAAKLKLDIFFRTLHQQGLKIPARTGLL